MTRPTRPDPRLSAAMAGAVDLSALAARSRQASPSVSPSKPAPSHPARAADDSSDSSADTGGAAPGSAAAVIEVTEANFQTEVLQRSMQTPVVVDFWASWCGPCRQLSPALEKLAAEAAGVWVLATVDVDANPRLAQAFQVQSIPTVFAVIGGRPVDGFSGALPESQLRQWLDALLQAAASAGMSVEPVSGDDPDAPAAAASVDPRVMAAEERLAAGDFDGAEQEYQALLAESPADAEAKAGLIQVRLLRRLSDVDPATAVAAADAAPADVQAQLVAADVELLEGEAARAYARLVSTVRITAGEDREAARAHLVELFALAEPDDPAVVAARRALTTALF